MAETYQQTSIAAEIFRGKIDKNRDILGQDVKKKIWERSFGKPEKFRKK